MNRRQRRASTAKHKTIEAWQVPIVLDRDTEKVIGFVTLDPEMVPEGSDWGLQPGVNKEDQIILFSTLRKKTD